MSSFTANFLKLLGNSTAVMLLFLPDVSAIHEEHVGDDSVITTSSKPSSSVDPIAQERTDGVANKSKFIAGLIRDVEILQAHEEDYFDSMKKNATLEQLIDIQEIMEKKTKESEEIISSLRFIQTPPSTLTPDEINAIESAKSRGLTVVDFYANKALKKILQTRLNFINLRYKYHFINLIDLYHSAFNKYHQLKNIHAPTDISLYDNDILSLEQKIFSQQAIDQYQTFNRIILGIASIVDLRILPANTKRLLRASPTLYSLLEGNSTDLGHPDETFMLETIDGGPMKDREYLITHLLYTEKVLLQDYSSFHKREVELSISPYEKKFLEPTWQHPYALSELPYPEFLKPYPVERKERTPFVTSSSSASSSSSSFASSSSGYTAPSIEVSPSEALTDVYKPADLSLSPEIPKEDFLPVTEKSSMTLPLFSTVGKTVSRKFEKQEEDDSTAASSSTPPLEEPRLEITQPEESQTQEFAPPRPRGMRSFHAKIPETTPDHFSPLKGKHSKTLTKLFDNRMFSSVRYQDFAALWRSINGPDSIKNASSGGSHKALLDQNGKVVTGIFAHGEAQTFGKRTIKYVRDAFNQIGYDPTR